VNDVDTVLDALRTHANGGTPTPRLVAAWAADLIDHYRTATPDDQICGCGDGLSARQNARCANCQLTDRTNLEVHYEAMRSVARRYRGGWSIVEGEWWLAFDVDPEPITPAERRALDDLGPA